MSPIVPTSRPLYSLRCACEQSSMTARLCRLAICIMAFHVARVAEDMYRHNGSCFVRNLALNIRRMHIECGSLDIAKDGNCRLRQDGDDATDVRNGTDDNFISGRRIQHPGGDVQAGSTGGACYAVFCAVNLGKFMFKLLNLRPAEPTHHS